jgi:hypothetical protein
MKISGSIHIAHRKEGSTVVVKNLQARGEYIPSKTGYMEHKNGVFNMYVGAKDQFYGEGQGLRLFVNVDEAPINVNICHTLSRDEAITRAKRTKQGIDAFNKEHKDA